MILNSKKQNAGKEEHGVRSANQAPRSRAPQAPAGQYRNRKGKRDHYHVIIDDNHNLHPMKTFIDWDHPSLITEAQDQRIFARQEDKRRLIKWDKEAKWKELLAPGLMVVALLLIFLMAYFGFEKLGMAMFELAQQIGQVASSCTVQ